MKNSYKDLCLNIVRQAIADCVDDSVDESVKKDAVEFLSSDYSKFLRGLLTVEEQQKLLEVIR